MQEAPGRVYAEGCSAVCQHRGDWYQINALGIQFFSPHGNAFHGNGKGGAYAQRDAGLARAVLQLLQGLVDLAR